MSATVQFLVEFTDFSSPTISDRYYTFIYINLTMGTKSGSIRLVQSLFYKRNGSRAIALGDNIIKHTYRRYD